jgi:prolyl-tRNA synthetase
MRLSKLFGRTLREVPAEATIVSHQLLLRAGMIRPLAAGIYSYLPLGWRALRKIEGIMRQEMDSIGGQEIRMPSVHPAELWQATGRYEEAGPVMARFRDRTGRELVLGITHEEVVTDLARREINSYRQLPFMVYQIQTKFRDEPRSRGGLIRAREFTMKDAYSFHANEEDLDDYYPQAYQAYLNIFRRCGLEPLVVEADPGLMGGSASHEFMLLNEAGEDTLVLCQACGYAANAEGTVAMREQVAWQEERSLEEVATPGMMTIQEVADYLGVPTKETLKAIFYIALDQLVFVIIRGDLEVNEAKLARLLEASELRLATEEEVKGAGIVPGYASPLGLKEKVKIVADRSIREGSNFVAGANKEGYHLKGVNYPRDFEVDILADIAVVCEGDLCPRCKKSLCLARGVELGHIFKLGTRYSEALGATFLDKDGQKKPLVMGCYGIGTGRLLAAVIEESHDEKGIIWPPEIAPYQIHLIALDIGQAEVSEAAKGLYGALLARGYELLYDDREESPGVKFNDADLIGLPLRLTVSRRTLEVSGVEVKRRDEESSKVLELPHLYRLLDDLYRDAWHF